MMTAQGGGVGGCTCSALSVTVAVTTNSGEPLQMRALHPLHSTDISDNIIQLVSKMLSTQHICLKRGPVVTSRSAKAVPAAASSVSAQPTVQFQFAPILNGCWQLAGGHGRDVFDNVLEKLEAHADAGLTTFDTADIYGPSEKILGDFLRQRAESGKAPVQVFTKYVPNIFQSRPSPASVEAALKKSCAALQVSQLDAVQLHWWDYGIPGMVDTAKALADCQAKGLVKHVAATNMDCDAMEKMLDAGVPLVSNQVQFSLLDRRPLNGMLQLCEERGLQLFTYGSVAGGLLSDKHVAPAQTNLFGQPKFPNVDLNTSSLKMYWNVARMNGGQEYWRELLAVLRKVADRHGNGTTVANVSLAWVMAQGSGRSVHPIVGLRTTDHIQDNKRALELKLTEADFQEINEVLSKSRGPQGDIYSFERS